MNDFIFKEQAAPNPPRMKVAGFTDSYREMLSTVFHYDFLICDDEPHIIITDDDSVVADKEVPVIIIGNSGAKKKGRIYLRRPVDLAILRQTALSLVAQAVPSDKNRNPLTLNRDSLTVSSSGKSASLSALEFRLFSLLYEAAEPVSRSRVKEELWPDAENSNVCDVYVCYLRKKLEPLFGKGFIVSVRGKGYVLNLPQK